MPGLTSLRPLMVAALLAATFLAAIDASMVVGKSSGTVAVTGASVETIRFGTRDVIGEFRAKLAAEEGDPRARFPISPAQPDTAVCYTIADEITVSSNVSYDVLVLGDGRHPGLRFLAEPSADSDVCSGGEPISETMFPTADPPGGWALAQARTPLRVHRFAIGLVGDPTKDPLDVLGDAAITVLVQPAS